MIRQVLSDGSFLHWPMMFEIVLSIAALLCLVVILIGCLDCLFKKKNRFEAFGIKGATHAEHNAAFSVDIFDADSISDQVIIEPVPDILSKVSAAPVLRPRITCTEVGKQKAMLSLLSVQRSFPRSHLTYLNEIGSGWFGKAIQSEAVQIVTTSYTSYVIVKMLRDDASKLEQKQFMEEVYAFRCLEHTNLLSLLGQCTETTPFLVILEFAALGNLKTYLVQNRQNLDTLISTNRLVSFALDAAAGLDCLHSHNYIHNDLAARNCLIMADYTLKIGDYGISDHLHKDEYYNNGTELLPVRWMAPETLTQKDGVWASHKCSKTSDAWSFGILLWEICSLGERPYDNLSNESVLQNVVLDRLVLPSEVNTKLPFKIKMWSLMIQCWEEPYQRMNMEQCHAILGNLKTQLDAVTSIDFDKKWNHLERSQVKRMNIGPETKTTSINSIAKNVPSATAFYELGAAPEASSGKAVVESGFSNNVSRDFDDILAPKLTAQPLHNTVDHNFSMIRKSSSSSVHQCQVVLENEVKVSSVSASYLAASSSLDQHIFTSTTSVSPGQGSTSQFFSPQSSPSSEYLTGSETYCVANTQEKTPREVCNSDTDISSRHKKLSFYELVDETLQDPVSQGDSTVVNNNNIESKCVPVPLSEDIFLETSHAPNDERFPDFESTVTAVGNSRADVQLIHEDDLCNIKASLSTPIVLPAPGKNVEGIYSELATSPEYTTNINNHGEADDNYLNSFNSVNGINSLSTTSDSVGSSNSDDGFVRSVDLPSEPESNFFNNPPGLEPEANGVSNNNSASKAEHTADFQTYNRSTDLKNTMNTSSQNGHISQQNISVEIVGSDQDQNVASSGLIKPGSSIEALDLQSTSLVAQHEHSKDEDEIEPSDSDASMDKFEESKHHFLVSADEDEGSAVSSVECLDPNSSADLPLHTDPTFDESDGKPGVVKAGSPVKNESNSAESGVYSHSLTESATNHGSNNNTEVDSSMYLTDSPIPNPDTHYTSDSSVAFLPEHDDEQDAWPVPFKSNLYRCSSIDLTADSQDIVEVQDNFKSTNEPDNNGQGDSQSPVDSDSESNNSNSESGHEYTGLGQDRLGLVGLGQPMTSSPDTAKTSTDTVANIEPSSPVDFDDYALQIASEIYLSRGLKSPRTYEIQPLETIPEHQPMPDIHEDLNHTPSDTSSVEVRYDEMFGGDSYEWDDFYGDPLIGKDISHQNSLPQHNQSFRENDVSDWSMDIDTESTASGISILSNQSEVSLNASRQSQVLSSHTDTSLGSARNLFPSFSSESTASSFSRNNDSSRETLVSSLLSSFQSPVAAPMTSRDKNNFYSLTEKYELETDSSSSDGLTSPTAGLASVAESPSSFAESPPPFAHLPGPSFLPAPSSSDTSDSEMSDHHADFIVPESSESNVSTVASFQLENEQHDYGVSDDKSSSAIGQTIQNTPDLTANQSNHVPAEDIVNEDGEHFGVNSKTGFQLLDPDNSLDDSSSI